MDYNIYSVCDTQCSNRQKIHSVMLSVCYFYDVAAATVATVDIRSHRMILWDLGGQEDLQQLWDKVGVFHVVIEILYSISIHELHKNELGFL